MIDDALPGAEFCWTVIVAPAPMNTPTSSCGSRATRRARPEAGQSDADWQARYRQLQAWREAVPAEDVA